MSNSPLVDFTRISPNKTNSRKHAIDTITIHCVVGQLSVEALGAGFAPTARRASSNYGVGFDGRIGMYVEEKDRSWCSSNYQNDDRAITIEVASDTTYPYAVNEKAYNALINLLVDICKRNNIKKLLWKNDKSLIGQVDKQNMTLHRWFAATECPGEYLYSKHGQIAAEVNARLESGSTSDKPSVSEKDDVSGKPSVGEKDDTTGYTKIVGTAKATAEQMIAYIKKKNPNVPQSVIEMIPFYISEGKTEGIRGDVAFAQSCIETGNYTFPQNTCAVSIEQNNFCMMGVTGTFEKGNSFETPQLGIRAQIQHLKAYSSKDPLVGKCIDPRFNYVTRGCAPYVEWLGMKENPEGKGWASAKNYGSKILRVLSDVLKTDGGAVETEPSKPSKPDTEEPKPSEKTNVPFTINVTISDLAIRKGPGTNYDKTGAFTGKGIFTIVEVKDGAGSDSGWGRLKSGAGWISLDYGKNNTSTKPTETSKTDNVPYKVKVDISNLNIRKGPGSNFNKTGVYTGKGIFTIVEICTGEGSNSGWGRLKSGAGWISLDYTEKV